MQFIRIKNLITVLVILAGIGWGSNAFALNMSLSDTCGYATQCIRVQIWGFSGKNASVSVNPDKSINLPASVVEGTRLSAFVNMTEECGFPQSSPRTVNIGGGPAVNIGGGPAVNIPGSGTKNSISPGSDPIETPIRLFGPWTPAKDNGVLPVRCDSAGISG